MPLRILAALAVLTPLPALAQPPADKPTPVIVEEARTDHFVDRIEALGTLRANETVKLTVNVAETVTDLHFDDGQRVEKGDILVEMTSAEESALLDEAQAAAAEAKRQLERLKPLAGKGATSESVLDERRREYQTAQARLVAIESRLKDRIVRAPFSGVVGLRNISVGALVEPGTLITTLNDDSRMKLDFSVPSVFLPVLRPGLPVVAKSRALPGMSFEGELTGIDNQIDPVTRSIAVRAILPNDQGALKQGLLMTVELIKNPRDAVVVSEEALIPEGRKSFVLVVQDKDGKTVAEKREVQVGARRPGEVEILAGVKPGERVVTHGTTRARPGQPVTVTAVETGTEPLQELLTSKKTNAAEAN